MAQKTITLALLTGALTSFWAKAKDYIDNAISTVTGGLFDGEKVSADKLPVATTTAKGVVSVGSNISVTNGAISVPLATSSVKGVASFGSGLTVDNGAVSVDFTAANSYADQKIADLVNGAPQDLDTLKEIAEFLSNDSDTKAGLVQQIAKKADSTELANYVLVSDVATEEEVADSVNGLFTTEE